MKRQEIYAFLAENGVWHEITEHKAVFNMAELAEVEIPYPEADAKNLFVRDDKKRGYYLLTVRGEKRVDLKQFRRAHGLRPLSFASEEELASLLGLFPGAVTPLGLFNDAQRKAKLFLDAELLAPPGLVGVHPNDNTATVWLKTKDLVRILRERGSEVEVVEI